HRIDHHVAGAGIKSYDLAKRRARGNRGQIRNAANVLRNAVHALITVQKIVDERHQRRVFPSASAYSSPRRKFNRARSATRADSAFIILRIVRRTRAGKGYSSCARNVKSKCLCGDGRLARPVPTDTRTSATLIPSAEVPLITPAIIMCVPRERAYPSVSLLRIPTVGASASQLVRRRESQCDASAGTSS